MLCDTEKHNNQKKSKAKEIILALFENENICSVFEQVKKIQKSVMNYVIKRIHRELEILWKETVIFDKFNSAIEFKNLDLEADSDQVQQHASLLFQLIEELSENHKEIYQWNLHDEQIVLVTSILFLNRAWNSVNCFACLLDIYLQNLNVKQWVLSLLHELELIDEYKTLNSQKNELTQHSKKDKFQYSHYVCMYWQK